MTSVETQIRSADPLAREAFLGADSPAATAILESVLHEALRQSRERRSRGPILVGATIAAAAVIITLVMSSTTAPPASSASLLLAKTAKIASAQPTLPALLPGQYYYQRTVVLQNCTFVFNGAQGQIALTYLTPMAIDTWSTSDGSGSQLKAPLGSGHFETAQQAATWANSGQKSLPCMQPTTNMKVPPVTADQPGVSELPTDAATLGALIAAGRVDDVGKVSPPTGKCPSKNGNASEVFGPGQVCDVAAQFDIVNNLLEYPEASVKLGPTLYIILSWLPGIEILGARTDALGRTGTAIEDPSSGDVIVFDQSNGMLLETQILATSQTAKPGVLPGHVVSSTTYGSVSVVAHDGTRPS
jgi:hypothetical protein